MHKNIYIYAYNAILNTVESSMLLGKFVDFRACPCFTMIEPIVNKIMSQKTSKILIIHKYWHPPKMIQQ